MNILREISRGGKGKLLNPKSSKTLDFGTIAATALHEPNVETKKVIRLTFLIFKSIVPVSNDNFHFKGYLRDVMILAS